MILNIISWLVFGLIVGAVAKLLIPGYDSHSWINSILLGIAGSFVGGFIAQAIWGKSGETTARYAGWGMSIVGAVLLQLAIRMIS